MGLISLRTPEEQRVLFGGTSEVGLLVSGLLFTGLLSAFKLLGSVCCMCVCACVLMMMMVIGILYILWISAAFVHVWFFLRWSLYHAPSLVFSNVNIERGLQGNHFHIKQMLVTYAQETPRSSGEGGSFDSF